MSNIEDERARRVLILGGKPSCNARSLEFESARRNGSKLFFASCVAEAWNVLQTEQIDQIAIEAFMENKEHETPFHFLPKLQASPYSHIPVVVVAAEPSDIGSEFCECIAKAATIFGAAFVLAKHFDPAEARLIVNTVNKKHRVLSEYS